jgi:hypothetical protein
LSLVLNTTHLPSREFEISLCTQAMWQPLKNSVSHTDDEIMV